VPGGETWGVGAFSAGGLGAWEGGPALVVDWSAFYCAWTEDRRRRSI